MAKQVLEGDVRRVEGLCKKVLGASPREIVRMGGATNRTYHVYLNDGREYVARIPGEGTEEIIVREDEKKSTFLASKLGIDTNILYFDDLGQKISEYIKGAVTMDDVKLRDPKRIEKVAAIFRTLHSCDVDTAVPFEVFDMARVYEKVIYENNVPLYPDYEEVKSRVMGIKEEIDALCKPTKAPCHNDALCENWVEDENERLYLIDWEYAGMNDPFWDLADVSIEAKYTHVEDELILNWYLDKKPSSSDSMHLLANKIYVDYLWTLWAKTRVPFDGKPMENWADERYARLKTFIGEYERMKGKAL